jgi:hypothetical protein
MEIRDIIAYFAFLVSCCTLYFVIKAGKSIITQESRKKQLEIVSSLISDITNLRDLVSLRFSKGTDRFPVEREMNFFDIARLNYFPFEQNYEIYFYYPLTSPRYQIIWNYLSNPLLPKTIADSLENLKRTPEIRDRLSEKEATSPYFIINGGDSSFKTEFQELMEGRQFFSHINHWLGECRRFHKSIMDWYKKVGVTDINQIALEFNNEEEPEPNA